MKPGEICLAMFPFGDAPGMKLRPVLLLAGPFAQVNEVLVGYISSAIPAVLLPTDVLLDPSRKDHQSANLKVISVLRLHKLATINVSVLARRLGLLPPALKPDVSAKLRQLLRL